MKRVLIISYYFPPDPEIGGLRIKGLAKYFPYFGWEPIILTKNSHEDPTLKFTTIKTSFFEYSSKSSFKKRLGLNPNKTVKNQLGESNIKNKRTLLDKLLDSITEIITYPDDQKIWYSHAFEAGDKLLANEKFDAIISSSSPIISHIVAHDLKEKHGLPWIADLRDLWTQNHYYPYSFARKFFETKLELKTLAESDALTTVSENLALRLKVLHKGISVYSIQNGFDLDEFNGLNIDIDSKFVITYTGSLYQGKRDPSKLFQALKELIDEQTINRECIEVRFYGPQEDWMKHEIEKYDLKGVVHDYGLVSRDLALSEQRRSQLLLLLLWNHPSEVGVYTGKLFEYLTSKRPILAIGGQKGVVNDLLEETNAGSFASSVNEIKYIIKEYYNEYKLNGHVIFKGNISKIEKYSQKEAAKKFIKVLNTISEKRFNNEVF